LESDFPLITNLVYAGDGSYWVSPKSGTPRNPDFILLKPHQFEAHRIGTPLNDLRTSAVVEVFGDYWHSPERIGKDRKLGIRGEKEHPNCRRPD